MWGLGLVFYVSDYVRDQIRDLNKINEKNQEMKSYIKQMHEYKVEMKDHLTKEFPAFEERIIKNISDSKALATIIEKKGYQKILAIYDQRIADYLNKIASCERSIAQIITNLRTHQEDKLGFGLFIPRQYRY
jgi:hypothetical protein